MYWHNTRAGVFRIVREPRGWMLWHGDDCFDGPFHTAQHALDDLAGGHCAWPDCGDPSQFGLPEQIDDWATR
jgi:hypothetical protein